MKVHVAAYDTTGIEYKKQNGWKEVKRIGDLVEMEYVGLTPQRAAKHLNKTMLTMKSGLKGMFRWMKSTR